jgi:mannose/cellobiose epimerase-like protein (N-acyl-D-glucosamine 2-epimerase family)
VTAPARYPDFRSPEFLRAHMRQILDFYHPRCINRDEGGYYNEFRDDGTITDRRTQHLVSTTRFIINYSLAAGLFGSAEMAEGAAHGVRYLDEVHRDPVHGGYFWNMDGRTPRDDSKQCYGHAFVLCAYANAAKAGVEGARAKVGETFDLLEERFWSAEAGLYVDEISRDWKTVDAYRGQNANMHMTEAMIAAFEATGEAKYLDRAELLARRICVELAAGANGLVWEHYRSDWTIDWEYNRDNPKHLFRPYGHLPGHFTEWTKLLLVLERYVKRDWLVPAARRLYDVALGKSADLENGGMHYSFGPDFVLHDMDKYHWVHCETLAAAACLAVATGEARFWQDYDRLWAYSWNHLVDRERGGWYRLLTADGRKYDDLKSPASKTDYHPFGACFEILRVGGHVG